MSCKYDSNLFPFLYGHLVDFTRLAWLKANLLITGYSYSLVAVIDRIPYTKYKSKYCNNKHTTLSNCSNVRIFCHSDLKETNNTNSTVHGLLPHPSVSPNSCLGNIFVQTTKIWGIHFSEFRCLLLIIYCCIIRWPPHGCFHSSNLKETEPGLITMCNTWPKEVESTKFDALLVLD